MWLRCTDLNGQLHRGNECAIYVGPEGCLTDFEGSVERSQQRMRLFFHSKSATPQLGEVRANQPFVSHTDTEMSVNSVWHGSLLSLLALITMGFEVVDWYEYQSVDEVGGGAFPLVTQFALGWGAVFRHGHDVKWFVLGLCLKERT